ncbi:MAG: serine protein kinase, partial [Gammaproteobacteria bacterium]
MTNDSQARFIDSLTAFTKEHQARHWEGSFAAFLGEVLPQRPHGLTRNSHQYVWDMLRRAGLNGGEEATGPKQHGLFADELFGIDDALERAVDYFKAASAGSEVGRRLLLLLGPPSGGKSTMVIL